MYWDGYLKSVLDTAKTAVQKDWDMVFCIDGTEGGGKSVFAQQIAYYCDPTININRVTFTPEEFIEAVKHANKYEAVIFDEGYTGLSSRGAMTEINRAIVEMLAEIRQKNLFIIIVVPSFFDLDRYVALHRSRALLHIYTNNGFERGYFMFFNKERKQTLYLLGKKTYNYNCVKSNFHGRFGKGYVVDEDSYRQKKTNSLMVKKINKKREDKVDNAVKQKWLFNRLMELDIRITNEDKAKLIGIAISTYYKWLDEYNTVEISKPV